VLHQGPAREQVTRLGSPEKRAVTPH
jgi:hypothetical protein